MSIRTRYMDLLLENECSNASLSCGLPEVKLILHKHGNSAKKPCNMHGFAVPLVSSGIFITAFIPPAHPDYSAYSALRTKPASHSYLLPLS